MRIAHQIQSASLFAKGVWESVEFAYHDRLEQLSSHRCNPEIEWDLLEAQLSQQPRQREPSNVPRTNFDGTTHVTHSFAGAVEPIPGYVALHMIERVGTPLKSGNSTIAGEVAAKCRVWLAHISPNTSLSLLLRAHDAEQIKDHLDAPAVALMPQASADRLRRIAVCAVERSMHVVHSDDGKIGRATRDILVAAVTVLGRILARGDQACGEAEVKQILRLYETGKNLQVSLSIDEVYGELIRVVRTAVPSAIIARYLIDFASLPVPGSSDFPHPAPHRWPDPLRETRCDPAVDRAPDDRRWAVCVESLLGLAESANATARMRAIIRLMILSRLNLLSEAELGEFGRALWSRTDESTGLPAETGLRAFTFLGLPAPDPNLPEKLLRHACVGQRITPLVIKTVGPHGKPQSSMPIGSDLTPWVATFQECAARPTKARPSIDWTRDECLIMVNNIAAWWNLEKPEIRRLDSPFRNMFGNGFAARISTVLSALSEVVAPRLERGGDGSAEVCRLITEMVHESAGELALPAVAHLSPESEPDVIRQIRRSIVGSDADRVDASNRAVYTWAWNSVNLGWRDPPGDLLRELGNTIALRRNPGLRSALISAAGIVSQVPSLCSPEFTELIARGLSYLIAELAYDTKGKNFPWDGNERLQLRIACAGLARQMAEKLHVSDLQWISEANADPLREVRLALAPATA